MAKWTGQKVDKSQLNGGEEYNLDSDVALQELNSIVNNSLFASNIAENVASQLTSLGASDKVEFKGSNPNLLINGDFRVNQRGLTKYNSSGFSVDGWKQYGGLLLEPTNEGLKITRTTTGSYSEIVQPITNSDILSGKTATLSVCMDNIIYSKTYSLSTTMPQSSIAIEGFGNARVAYSSSISCYYVGVYDVKDKNPNATPHTVNWVKLELGSVATAYSPKPYEEELADCQCIEGGVATTYSNPNLLINGDFSVNQRKFDGTNIVRQKSTFCVDRWRYYHWGNSAEITKNDDGSISIFNTTTDTSQGTGILYFSQPVEHFSNRLFNNETYTVSCKYKLEYPDSSKQGECYFYFEQSGATTSGTLTGKLPKTTTPVIDTRTFTVNGTTTKGSVVFNLRQGAKLTIYWVKLEIGSIATAFRPRPYAEELALCQRYFRVLNKTVNNYRRISIGYAPTAKTARFIIPFGEMRTNPTIPLSPIPSGFTIYSPNVPLEYVDAVPSVDSIMLNFKIPDDNTTALTVNQPVLLYSASVAGTDGKIYLDAEIY